MNSRLSRRSILKTVGAAALMSRSPREAGLPVLHQEGPETPKICLEINGKLAAGHVDETGMRRVKQLGVNHVAMVGPEIPWEESQIRALVDRLSQGA